MDHRKIAEYDRRETKRAQLGLRKPLPVGPPISQANRQQDGNAEQQADIDLCCAL